MVTSGKTDAEASKETRNRRKLKQDFGLGGKIKVLVFAKNRKPCFFLRKKFDARNRKINQS